MLITKGQELGLYQQIQFANVPSQAELLVHL